MKTIGILGAALLLAACHGNTQQRTELKSQKDSISYMIGMDIGKNLKAQSIDVNSDALAQGMKAMLDSSDIMLTDEQCQQMAQELQHLMMAKQEEKMKVSSDKNKKEGETFLTENKKKEGVVVLPDGLQYKIIKKGTGKIPKVNETVTVHYRGTLIDGTEFDSSYKRGQPATFQVDGVMKGWVEALQLMPVGSKWELYIPPELGYGERGMGQTIGPNATLIFEVELIAVK